MSGFDHTWTHRAVSRITAGRPWNVGYGWGCGLPWGAAGKGYDLRKGYKRRITSSQIIIMGFAGVILLGAMLLWLPVSRRAGAEVTFLDSLFTAVSAVCVTGLVVHDTATTWSAFGQAVILLLIQIGGMGVITVAASFAMISGKRIYHKEHHGHGIGGSCGYGSGVCQGLRGQGPVDGRFPFHIGFLQRGL